MELSQYGLMDHELIMAPKEELIMSPNIDTTFSNDQFLPNPWNLINNPFYQNQDLQLHYHPPTNPSFLELISQDDYRYSSPFSEFQPLVDAITSPEFSSFNEPLISSHEEFASNVENFEFFDGVNGCEDGIMSGYNVEGSTAPFDTPNMGSLGNVGLYEERRSKSKKPEGQPSKNLMAERRRRKRLNDRLSMLRSIVPKISKMDRTAILGDTIDYMKELLDKIQQLKEEGLDEKMNQITFMGNYLKELKPNEVLVRNPPKFEVERRKDDTRVEVYCTPKPGLLLSTLGTLDALSLDIQQCVISCFNDFSVQASCYEIPENQSIVSADDIKQALFRNAGYAGRCL